MSSFEDLIKNKVEQHHVPFDEAQWVVLDKKLTTFKRIQLLKKVALLVFGIIAIIGITYVSYINYINTDGLVVNRAEVHVDNTTIKTPFNNEIIENQQVIIGKEPIIEKTNPQNIELIDEMVQISTKKETEVEIETASVSTNDNKTIIENNTKINGDFIVVNNRCCLGEEITFEALETENHWEYLWEFGDGNVSNKSNVAHQFNKEGSYTVTLTVVDKKAGRKKSTQQKVTVNPLPLADFSYNEQCIDFDDNKLKYPNVDFTYLGDSNDSYFWNFGNEFTSKDKSPSIFYEAKGIYNVSLLASNKFGCSNAITKKITVNHSFHLFAPSAFTPNFDRNNDEFLPEALSLWGIEFEMVINNQEGNQVYKTNNKNEPWLGKLNNEGPVLESGLYFWQVITYDAKGNAHKHYGKLNLIK